MSRKVLLTSDRCAREGHGGVTESREPKCSLSFAEHLTLFALLLCGTSGFQLKVEVDDLGFPDATDARPLRTASQVPTFQPCGEASPPAN